LGLSAVGIWLAMMAVFFAFLAAAALVLERRHALGTPADEVHEASTSDGWRISLARYRPRGDAPGVPVLLCHGLMSNRFSLDLDAEVSLARHLREEGFDVWLMDLRAHGASRRAPGSRRPRSPYRAFAWSMDEYVTEDLPAAARRVMEATGAAAIHYVGHSLGGMILYALAARGDLSWCRAAVTIDSPGHFGPLKFPTLPARIYARLVPVVPIIVFKPLAHFLYVLIPGETFRRRIGLPRSRLVKILYNALVNVGSSRVLLHLCRCLAEGRFRSFGGAVDYEEGPRRIAFPLMVLRAAHGQTPEACVRRAFDEAASKEKEYVRLSRAGGFAIDHNHFTPVLGSSAPLEVYPLIASWLRRH